MQPQMSKLSLGSLGNPRILQSNNLQRHRSLIYIVITSLSQPIGTRQSSNHQATDRVPIYSTR
jgi:hypothetical protein